MMDEVAAASHAAYRKVTARTHTSLILEIHAV